jgi:hypothetical protein
MHESANPTVGFLEICRDCICQMVASWGIGDEWAVDCSRRGTEKKTKEKNKRNSL